MPGKKESEKCMVIFQPSGRRGNVEKGKTLKEASVMLGVDIEGICGEKAICGKCRVRMEEGVFENARQVGAHLGARLEELKSRHPVVGDARYIGLFSALELVKDKNTKEAVKDMAAFGKFLRDHGLFTFIFGSVVFIVPPLCITQAQLDEGLAIIEQALTQISDPLAAIPA